ncbi:MAG: FAD-dependent pyridine nucleotide-disulfide oxidoreductase [Deltaproteobacteria bacterium]|nr:FAD-dependent pyridine nucleotide-disulfide oxidoreductase [Deltaproteobacteria bacterium]
MTARNGDCQVIIIGAGFGGLGMAIRLKQRGEHRFVILEQADDVGGCWRDNTYPGAACDVPSHLYSFSFEPSTGWSRAYAPQPEIHAYLRACARKYGLLSHIRFGTCVRGAAFDARAGQWIVDAEPHQLRARALVVACGQLSRPAMPRIAGIERFRGAQFHSARWNHDYALDGRRVAVIGTGASAIQFVPAIAPRVSKLSLFQRSPAHVIPKPDRAYSSWERALQRRLPALTVASRAWSYLRHESRAPAMAVPTLMAGFEWLFRRHLERQIRDPELRKKLTPDYPIGCKRILISNDYYPTLTRDNVDVVTDAIREITEDGIVTEDGSARGAETPVDAIIYGTGFTANEFLAPMVIRGLHGTLASAWQHGAEAHLGITVSGFPNMFLLYGPNTNLGHNSIIYMLESQIHYVMQCLEALHRARYLDVRADAQHAFNTNLQQQLAGSVWAGDCTSWYKTAEGKLTNNWPGFTFSYRRLTRTLDLDDYTIAQ